MPRPPRVESAGALYDVMARGNARRRIYLAEDDYLRLLHQSRNNLAICHVVLYAYVLIDDHYHLLLKATQPNLSRFMQRSNTSYALCSRHRRRRPGHVFQGRYRAKIVEDDQYTVPLSRYIHLNPVRTTAGRRLSPSYAVRLPIRPFLARNDT